MERLTIGLKPIVNRSGFNTDRWFNKGLTDSEHEMIMLNGEYVLVTWFKYTASIVLLVLGTINISIKFFQNRAHLQETISALIIYIKKSLDYFYIRVHHALKYNEKFPVFTNENRPTFRHFFYKCRNLYKNVSCFVKYPLLFF